MNAYPFSIFKRADRSCYSVSFKTADGKYLRPVSTGKKTEDEAREVAFQMLRDGIQKNETSITVNDLSLKDTARKIKNEEEAKTILAELKRLGWVKGYIPKNTDSAMDFITFLKTFWDWEKSPYIEEKLRKKNAIHKRHCKLQLQAISLFWEKHLSGKLLGQITPKEIDSFINYMGTFDLSAARKNVVIKAGLKPLRWAFAKSMIEIDPTRGHILFTIDDHKRKILTPMTAAAIFKFAWKNERAQVGNMLASVTGMREGEIQSLKIKGIGDDYILVSTSWNKEDGLKTTKNNETRRVEIPFPFIIYKLRELAMKNPHGTSPENFVFWSAKNKDQPMHGTVFLDNLRKALIQIGFTEEQAAEYDFHGWRHFFVAYMVKNLERKLLKSQTGHLTDDMIDLYGDHETVGDREEIQAKQIETFAGLIPELPKPVLLLEYKPQNKAA